MEFKPAHGSIFSSAIFVLLKKSPELESKLNVCVCVCPDGFYLRSSQTFMSVQILLYSCIWIFKDLSN
jgi:hypothetical protein